jgi:NAD(P)-dependent dehydrogenase (short-subunit alcohol dehydrogenase family)
VAVSDTDPWVPARLDGRSTHHGAALVSRLAGRRVVVTGGARGVGAAVVRTFAAEGARLVVLDRRFEEAAVLAKEVGGRAYDVDLADVRATREVLDRAICWLGGVDVLVNTAGVLRFGALLDLDPAEWDEVFAVNTRAMLVTTQVAARAMIAYRTPSDDCAGKIINMARAGGRTAGAGYAHYAAAKAAVLALSRAAAQELGPHGITVNCLCPGYVRTDTGTAVRTVQDVAAWSALSPLGRPAEPADVARAALFLASADADYLTGDAIDVAGGLVVH